MILLKPFLVKSKKMMILKSQIQSNKLILINLESMVKLTLKMSKKL